MSQQERDRLKVLHEASKSQLAQKQAAGQLKVSERQLRRMLSRLREAGDSAVVHGLRGRVSNPRVAEDVRQRAVEELSPPECAGFGPTFAAEHLKKHLKIECTYLIAMIDDATSRVHARFAAHDNRVENIRILWSYLEQFGRPLAFYTDKAGMFETTPKRSTSDEEPAKPAATQITRALAELSIERDAAPRP